MQGCIDTKASRQSSWRGLFLILSLVVGAILPIWFGTHSNAQTSFNFTAYVANLSGPPIGNVMPTGQGHFFADSANNRAFETEISSVALPSGTQASISQAQSRASPAQFSDMVLVDAGSDSQPWAVLLPKSGGDPILMDRVGSGADQVGTVYKVAAQPVIVGTRDADNKTTTACWFFDFAP